MIPTYVIGGYGRNITCLECGRTSWHPQDIENLYCGGCHEFHADKEIRRALRAPSGKKAERVRNDDRFPEWS